MNGNHKYEEENKDKKLFDFRGEVNNRLEPNVTLISNDNIKVKGHLIILARCPYFQHLFLNQKTANSKLIFEEDLPGEVLEFVVKYIYTGEFELLDIELLPQILEACSEEKYNLPNLAKSYLLEELEDPEEINPKNWLLFFRNGIKFNFDELIFIKIYNLLKEKYPDFYKTPEFKGLSYDEIYKMMASINPPFENFTMMEATLHWTRNHMEIESEKLAELSKICTNAIQNANDTFTLKRSTSSGFESLNKKPNNNYAYPRQWDNSQLLFTGKNCLWSYSFQTGQIKPEASSPILGLKDSCLLVSRDSIYCMGGNVGPNVQNKVHNLYASDFGNLRKKWRTLPSFQTGLCNMSTLLIENQIYLFGGMIYPHICKSILKFDGKLWKNNEKHMIYLRERFGVAIINWSTIYMVGGRGYKANQKYVTISELDTAESYDTDKNTQKLLPNLKEKRVDLCVATLNYQIYAIGGLSDCSLEDKKLNSVESYKPGDLCWKEVANMNQPRSKGKAFVLDGMIYMIGGNSGKPTMERYSPKDNKWTMVVSNLPDWADLSNSVLLQM